MKLTHMFDRDVNHRVVHFQLARQPLTELQKNRTTTVLPLFQGLAGNEQASCEPLSSCPMANAAFNRKRWFLPGCGREGMQPARIRPGGHLPRRDIELFLASQ
jgi:hypothetical protein